MNPSPPTIRVVEPIWQGAFHVPINAGVLEILSAAFPTRRIVFASESEHGNRVFDMLPAALADDLEFLDLSGPSFADLWAIHRSEALSGSRPVRAAWRAYRLLSRILRADDAPTDLLLTSTTPSVLFGARAARSRRYGPRNVEAIIHGTLAHLEGERRSRRPLRRALDLRGAISGWIRDGGSLTVLENHIPGEAAKRMPLLATPGALKVLPHPTLDALPSEPPLTLASPVRIGFMGVITNAKGAAVFIRLVRAFAERTDLRLEICGFLPDPVHDVDLDGLDEPVSTEPLPRQRYEALLSELHYVCLPLPGRYYDLTASGTVVDAILHLKPLITLDGPLTRRLFAEAGDIGHLCADERELHRTTDLLARTPDPDRYRSQVEALRRLRDHRRPQSLATLARERWFRSVPVPEPSSGGDS